MAAGIKSGQIAWAVFKFEKLMVWQRAIDLYVAVEPIANQLPLRVQRSLADQLRRAALSVSANIAEGTGRQGARESRQFFNIAKGSTYEVVSLLEAGARSRQITTDEQREIYERCDEIARMLSGLLRT